MKKLVTIIKYYYLFYITFKAYDNFNIADD